MTHRLGTRPRSTTKKVYVGRRGKRSPFAGVAAILITGFLGLETSYVANLESPPQYLAFLREHSLLIFGALLTVLLMAELATRMQSDPKLEPPMEWPEGRTPYPGLEPFTADDEAVFFGRRAVVEAIVTRISEAHGSWHERLIVMIGASGSGKSSIVQAGVLPSLEKRRWWSPTVCYPSGGQREDLANAFHADTDKDDDAAFTSALHYGSTNELAVEIERARRKAKRARANLILVVDQFEDALTSRRKTQPSNELVQLKKILTADPRARALVVLRSDYFDALLRQLHSPEPIQPIAIPPIDSKFVREIVEAPGRLAGINFAPEVVDRIQSEFKDVADSLPLLAYLLQELSIRASTTRLIGLDDYDRAGGIAKAVARQAEIAVKALRDKEGLSEILESLLTLVQLDEHGPTRRIAPAQELSQQNVLVLEEFVAARLVSATNVMGKPGYRFAHEAILRHWRPLESTIQVRYEFLRQRSLLESWASAWTESGNSTDYLLSGERLALAERWLSGDSAHNASARLRKLVHESRAHDDATLKRIGDGIAKFVLDSSQSSPQLSLTLAVAAATEVAQTPLVMRSLMTAMAHDHTARLFLGHSDVIRAVDWSSSGHNIATASRDKTVAIWHASSQELLFSFASAEMQEAVAFSPDGSWIAMGGRDNVVRLQFLGEARSSSHLNGARGAIRGIAWSPDGTLIAAGCEDAKIYVWDLGTSSPAAVLTGHTADVYGVAWSPDAQRLASTSHDATVRVWRRTDWAEDQSFVGHSEIVEAVEWSPDGSLLATASGDRSIRLWDPRGQRAVSVLQGHTDAVWSVAWSPDGSLLATSSSDLTVRVWDVATGGAVRIFRGHTKTVWSVAWSPDGQEVLSGAADTSARTWSIHAGSGEQFRSELPGAVTAMSRFGGDATLAAGTDSGRLLVGSRTSTIAHSAAVDGRVMALALDPAGLEIALTTSARRFEKRSVSNPAANRKCLYMDSLAETLSWSPDGHLLAVGRRDGRVALHDAETLAARHSWAAHDEWIGGAAWSPGGELLATASDDRTCRIWDVSTGRLVQELRGHENYVESVCWSPDALEVATCSADLTIRVWDVQNGRLSAQFVGHERRPTSVDWSADGAALATGSEDGTVRVWQVDQAAYSGGRIIGVHSDRVSSVAWTCDASTVASAAWDGSIRFWAREPDWESLLDKARSRATYALTQEDRRTHMLAESGPRDHEGERS